MAKTPMADSYTPLVEIKDVEDFRPADDAVVLGDRRDGKLYRYTPDIKLAINVALATGRPLLVLGATGCGKSCLAFNLARLMRRRYYEFVVTSRSQARDLFYRFDAVRRLGDAQLKDRAQPSSSQTRNSQEPVWQSQYPYIEPGPLWWSLDRAGAERRGCPGDNALPFPAAVDPVRWEPNSFPQESSLLLIDEIDKAEPDFPNNLLVPLGSWEFTVEEIAKRISLTGGKDMDDPTARPLIIITSNRERELPNTFLRRCIVLEIPPPTPSQLVELATTVFKRQDNEFFEEIANQLVNLRGKEHLSTAEFLDAVQAIQKLRASELSLLEIIKRSAWRSIES